MWAEKEYQKNGRPTSELYGQRAAMSMLLDAYATLPAVEFGPVQFRAVREAMVVRGWSRTTVNQSAGRVVATFGWAVGQGMIPASVPAQLREVEPLKAGKTKAPGKRKKKPVPDADVIAVFPHLSPKPERRALLTAMIRVQRRCGMRPGEICGMRPSDLDREGDVWVYTVPAHVNKSEHREQE